ncbi:chorismate mutase [Bacillus sp. GM2]|uniref:chorismate mutase n=1 Tax=Bacillus paralicheniformis TaxID=1648923 RepID=A0AAW6K753_9BACI|nr:MULTISPECIES: chorismate mutase [Bacillus]KAA0836301.1 chorismate mutase [Bacillus paralicheniformis]KAA0843399.1 chorismate mutase [Bacillus paralicheniformis]MBR8664740.1 chorismate mutase [Bacillus paralicheniformis]MDE1384937.1 chorismate mutase [Bacillus paralicheniformis]MDE1451694.1 chorismate mutase [Bacillus paralicheniformis]
MMMRGIRGATTVDRDTEKDITERTKQLIGKMIDENQLKPEQVVQIFISATSDIHAAFPAKVVRTFDGWQHVPVMCMQEMDVEHALKKCIRVMMTVQTDMRQDEVRHVYLENAVTLRPDLSLTKNTEL